MPRKLNDKEMEMVKRFFDLELSETELNEFSHLMETDADFKEHVGDFQDAEILATSLKRADLQPPELNLGNRENQAIEKRLNWKKLAASILLILVLGALGFYLVNSANQNASEKVYAGIENYVDKISDNVMRGGGETSSDLSPVQMTIKEIRSIDEKNEDKESIIQLEKLLSSTDDVNSKELIHWWLVKLYMNNGNEREAKKLLEEISNHTKYNSTQKAKELLGEFK